MNFLWSIIRSSTQQTKLTGSTLIRMRACRGFSGSSLCVVLGLMQRAATTWHVHDGFRFCRWSLGGGGAGGYPPLCGICGNQARTTATSLACIYRTQKYVFGRCARGRTERERWWSGWGGGLRFQAQIHSKKRYGARCHRPLLARRAPCR